jgi:hypothetical protein
MERRHRDRRGGVEPVGCVAHCVDHHAPVPRLEDVQRLHRVRHQRRRREREERHRMREIEVRDVFHRHGRS